MVCTLCIKELLSANVTCLRRFRLSSVLPVKIVRFAAYVFEASISFFASGELAVAYQDYLLLLDYQSTRLPSKEQLQ